MSLVVFVAAFYCYIDTLRKSKEDSSDSESDDQMDEGLDKKVSTNIVNFDLANGCFARHSLVKIIFMSIFTYFPVFERLISEDLLRPIFGNLTFEN